MSKILNLDKLIPDDRLFELAGKEFNVPGAFCVAEILETSKIAQEIQAHPEKLSDALISLWTILEPHNPKRKKSEFIDNLKLPMIGPLIDFIFNNQGGDEQKNDGGVTDNSKNECGK